MTPDFTIRTMTSEDIDSIAVIEKAVFSDPWPKSAFREMLREEQSHQSASGDRPGWRACRLHLRPDRRRRTSDSEYRGRAANTVANGWARLLLRKAEDEGVARGALCSVLDVRTTNEAALGLYQSFGYRMIGRRKNYYRQPGLRCSGPFPAAGVRSAGCREAGARQWNGFVKPKPA